MALFLFRFWPVVIPTLLYCFWLFFARARARKSGAPLPHFRDGPVYWLVIATLAVAMLCFIVMGVTREDHKGAYQPPHMENGTVTPAQVVP